MREIDLKSVKVVSWDIDGTMYDLHRLMSAFKRDLFRRMLSRNWLQAWRDFFRLLRFKRFMDRVRKRRGDYRVGPVPHRDRIAETQDEMYGRILPELGAIDGVKELLLWFEEKGVKQVVFSDYLASTKLTALDFSGFFSDVYAGETIGHLKPARETFDHIIDDLGIEPHQLLHIGDRLDTDAAAAPTVGYQSLLLGGHYPTAREVFERLLNDRVE